MKELVIDRRKWHRGKGGKGSRLLTPFDTMCCLGFYSKACGLKNEDILGMALVTSLGLAFVPSEMLWLGKEPSRPTLDREAPTMEYLFTRVNDNPDITDEQREIKLTTMFAEHGVAVTFVN